VKPEILAPLPAISMIEEISGAGSDRLYTGLRNRSREAVATTPDVEDLLALAREIPRLAERVHVALNVVSQPHEWKALFYSIEALLRGGYRNFIVNEHGFLRDLSRKFPGAALTGSVGLTAANPQDALFLEQIGASAVVMPLTSSPGDVKAIKDVTSIAVEVFAICRGEPVVQGKCMLPGYLLGKKSPLGETPLLSSKKTGLCYTVCRTVLGRYPQHDITGNIGEWINAGVDIFKIEGRYRNADEIVAMVKKVKDALERAGQ
jgi:putative protease